MVATRVIPAPSGSDWISRLPVPGFDLDAVPGLTAGGAALELPVALFWFEAGEQAAKASSAKAMKANNARCARVMQFLLGNRNSTAMINAGAAAAQSQPIVAPALTPAPSGSPANRQTGRSCRKPG